MLAPIGVANWFQFCFSLTIQPIHSYCHWNGCRRSSFWVPMHQNVKDTNRMSLTCLMSSHPDSETVDNESFSEEIVKSLNLDQFVILLSSYTKTRRSQQAFLALANVTSKQSMDGTKQIQYASTISRRQKLLESASSFNSYRTEINWIDIEKSRSFDRQQLKSRIAANASEARHQYELVEQAMLVYDKRLFQHNLTFPPFFNNVDESDQTSSRFKIKKKDDYDDWFDLDPQQWTLENVLQAEKLIEMIVKVYEWSNNDNTLTWLPLLADIVHHINITSLQSILLETEKSIEIVRIRTITDPSGLSSYNFRLSDKKYPILKILRQSMEELQKTINEIEYGKRISTSSKLFKELQEKLRSVEMEIEVKEHDIKFGLILAIYNKLSIIDHAFNLIAELDIIFAKASFSEQFCGKIPKIPAEGGTIQVFDFIHPLISSHPLPDVGLKTTTNEREPRRERLREHRTAIPIDLKLSSSVGEKALIISGSNGGGKTLSLKSFGVAAVLVKLGIPIPTAPKRYDPQSTDLMSSSTNVISFFDKILTSLGDQQNVIRGESTYTAQLNKYSSILNSVSDHRETFADELKPSVLILLDELGSGTEDFTGSSIGQALLETLLQEDFCRTVATTHSPRLKAISFENKSFQCAAVLLKKIKSDSDQSCTGSEIHQLRPSYTLNYGIIGESSGLAAAARSQPPFAAGFLQRVSDIMTERTSNIRNVTNGVIEGGFSPTAESISYNEALTKSMVKQLTMAEDAREKAEFNLEQIISIRKAMINLAIGYSKHLTQLDHRVETCFRDLKNNNKGAVTVHILGETLAELRTVRKRVKTDKEFLKEKGLKLLYDTYPLTEGDVVFLAKDLAAQRAQPFAHDIGIDMFSAVVMSRDALSVEDRQMLQPNDVVVLPSLSSWETQSSPEVSDMNQTSQTGQGSTMGQLTVAKMHELAIWDYDSIWHDNVEVTSLPEARRKLDVLLRDLSVPPVSRGKKSNPVLSSKFRSSRERKAANIKKSKRTSKKFKR